MIRTPPVMIASPHTPITVMVRSGMNANAALKPSPPVMPGYSSRIAGATVNSHASGHLAGRFGVRARPIRVVIWSVMAIAARVLKMMKNREVLIPVGGGWSRRMLTTPCGMRLQAALASPISNWLPALIRTMTP